MADRTVEHLLEHWLKQQLPPPAASWLEMTRARLDGDVPDRDLYLAVSLVPRKLGKDDLALTVDDLEAADRARPGWAPVDWTVDQAARILLILGARADADRFAQCLDQLCTTADVGELIAFYRGLPLYPYPDRHVGRAAEGARTNMKAVFNAVAHRNPYPAERFSEAQWNQMVLKALFIDSTLAPIQGLDRRTNPALMRMLCDYAHERWAAGRPVSPELWRCVGPHADAAALDDLARVLAQGGERDRAAAALALMAAPDPQAQKLLDGAPELRHAVESGRLSWESLAGDAGTRTTGP